jgi:hypothetical protein
MLRQNDLGWLEQSKHVGPVLAKARSCCICAGSFSAADLEHATVPECPQRHSSGKVLVAGLGEPAGAVMKAVAAANELSSAVAAYERGCITDVLFDQRNKYCTATLVLLLYCWLW